MTFRRILIAVDGQRVAEHAATVGTELARAVGAEVGLITVIDTSQDYAAGGGIIGQDIAAAEAEDARRLLARVRERLSLPAATLAFAEQGAPAAEIVKVAKEWPADLIVIGSHGRGIVGRALIGSVADAVLRHAPCPVLMIRATT